MVLLASLSPRRRELLAQIGVPFRAVDVAVDESVEAAEEPERYVVRLAAATAAAGLRAEGLRAEGLRGAGAQRPVPVLAADTAVVLDGCILGKPRDREDAQRMLLALADRTHEVLTAVAVLAARGLQTELCRSRVSFRAIGRDEARAYWETGEPCDKAGGYAIQGAAAVFVRDLQGSYSGVMGLPLFETAALLERAGVPRWRTVGRADRP